MKIRIAPRYQALEPFVRDLAAPDFFDSHGSLLHSGRNTVRQFCLNEGAFVVKRYVRLSFFNRMIYGVLRKSKAERAYCHAQRLRALGIDTPEAVAFVEIRRRGLLRDSYFVSVHSDYMPMQPVTELNTQHPEVSSVLDAMTAFLFRMHEAGVLHRDLNIGNILYKGDGHGGYVFQVIDTNRMTFCRRLSMRDRLDNLRRLSCAAPAYLYILDRYARLAHSNANSVQLKGAVMRLVFEMRQRLKRSVKSTLRGWRRSVPGF